jgi:formylglycine-generating enzyme required for sulfatase activity
MAVLFVSHSSKDDVAATGLESWLLKNGFTDLFIDHTNIAGGDKWAQALREASGACRVVICLVTKYWLESDECFAEFRAAWYMGRRIIPLLALQPGYKAAGDHLYKVLAEDQGFDVIHCMNGQGELDLGRDPQIERRLKAGLREAGALVEIGLDPEAFAIDRKLRPTPFPGLSSFGDDDADAALFYGRSREIAETLEELRQARAVRDVRPFVILSASGAGKSSLLKAGIIPRLRREVPAWLPLRAFRPGSDPLLNFAEALALTRADFGKVEASGNIRDRLLETWRAAERDENHELTTEGCSALDVALAAEARKLCTAAGRSSASILISVDQAEEMAQADGESGDALADYLRAASATPDQWQLVFTIRTDSFPELQKDRRFSDLNARGYDLRALPVFRFESVIESPAKRYGVAVDDALVDVLIEHSPKEDALPLLAFALQRLWRQYASSKSLNKDHYDKVGGLRGLIEDAAERALRGLGPETDAGLPPGPPPQQRIDLAASTFVPALVQVNDQGAMIRLIAECRNFTSEQQELMDYFDQWRLVVRKGGDQGGTVEVAHEALFREWTRLKAWLEPERARLDALRSLQVDALTWDRNGRGAAYVNHRDKRLAEATKLAGIDAYRKRLGPAEFDYLAACQESERLARRQRRRAKVLISSLVALLAVGLVGWLEQGRLKENYDWYTTVYPFLLNPAKERALGQGKTFHECAQICPEMVFIPGGRFMMGSTDREEAPPHAVTLQPFAASETEITFEQWDACVTAGGCTSRGSDNNWGRGKRPKINVTWPEAHEYTTWLAKRTGRPYRLLTEAEWEYLAANQETTLFQDGTTLQAREAFLKALSQHAWWNDNAKQMTNPVRQLKPTPFGLYDIFGNVWELVEDAYADSYEGAPDDGRARPGPEGSPRVARGGSWTNSFSYLTSTTRLKVDEQEPSNVIGFRIARSLPARTGETTAIPGPGPAAAPTGQGVSAASSEQKKGNSTSCTDRANDKSLHGKARRTFMSECKRAGGKAQ